MYTTSNSDPISTSQRSKRQSNRSHKENKHSKQQQRRNKQFQQLRYDDISIFLQFFFSSCFLWDFSSWCLVLWFLLRLRFVVMSICFCSLSFSLKCSSISDQIASELFPLVSSHDEQLSLTHTLISSCAWGGERTWREEFDSTVDSQTSNKQETNNKQTWRKQSLSNH